MIYGVTHPVSRLLQLFTLCLGDVIWTGTPQRLELYRLARLPGFEDAPDQVQQDLGG